MNEVRKGKPSRSKGARRVKAETAPLFDDLPAKVTTLHPYPPDAVCGWRDPEEPFITCGHIFAEHKGTRRKIDPDGFGHACTAGDDGDEDDWCFCPQFTPVRHAGGALSPDAERAAYEKAMHG